MKPLGKRSIASFIRIVLDATWWLVTISLVFLTCLLIFRSSLDLESNNLTMNLPVALELDTPVYGQGASAQTEAHLEKLRGNLRFPVSNGVFFSGSLILTLVLCSLLLWVLTLLRLLFRSLNSGQLFISENARRIRWVGFTLLVGEIIRVGAVYYWSYYTSQNYTVDGIHFIASLDFSGITIISGLIVLVIAEVFEEGICLREDQSLTI